MHIEAPFELIIFGGLGDLSQRKLLPAMYMLHSDGRLPQNGRIVLITRSSMTPECFLSGIHRALKQHLKTKYFSEELWTSFSAYLACHTIDLEDISTFRALAQDALTPDCENRVFYLATGSDLYLSLIHI